MTTPASRLAAAGQPPELTPAWWIHALNATLGIAALVLVGVHPGYKIPALVADTVGPLGLLLAVASGLVFAVIHHKVGQTRVSAAYAYLDRHAYDLERAVSAAGPIVDDLPALKMRVDNLEAAAQTTPNLPPAVLGFLQDLASGRQAPPTAPQPAPAAENPPPPAAPAPQAAPGAP